MSLRTWMGGAIPACPRFLLAVALLAGAACRTAMDSDLATRAPAVADRLNAEGEARVTVSLLVAPGAETEPAAIRRAGDAVLAALDTADFRVTHRFERVPAIGGVLRTERGLRLLLDHPKVRRVDLEVGGTGTR
jgi:hypothetical protein